MSLKIEGVVDGGMDVEKALRRRGRLEPLHLTFSSAQGLMGVLGTIVLSDALLMVTAEPEMPQGRAVAAQLVVTSSFGAKPCFLSSFRINRSAARLSRRR